MSTPQRIQRLRKKGFKLQEASQNGLPVKYVGRPTKWGNPFKLTTGGVVAARFAKNKWLMCSEPGFETKDIVELYERWINGELKDYKYLPVPPSIEELRGYNLACFCPLSSECHCDVILKLLNKPTTQL